MSIVATSCAFALSRLARRLRRCSDLRQSPPQAALSLMANNGRSSAPSRACRNARGAGSVLTIGVLCCIIATVLLLGPLARTLVLRSELTGAADAAALAAADVARGISAGVPCVVAESVARENGATMADCRVDGVIVTVRVRAVVLGFAVSATATAGPPFTGG